MSWAQFLKIHWEVLAASDFFTVEVATWHGESTWVSGASRASRWVAELLSSRGGVTRRIISTIRGVAIGLTRFFQ